MVSSWEMIEAMTRMLEEEIEGEWMSSLLKIEFKGPDSRINVGI